MEKLRANRAAILMFAVMVLFWHLTGDLQPSPLTYAIALPALVFLWVTAVARVNDIDEGGMRWQVRRAGLVLAVGGTVAFGMEPLYGGQYPTRGELLLLYGFVGTWLTTPNMPPWHRFISGTAFDAPADDRRVGERRVGKGRRLS